MTRPAPPITLTTLFDTVSAETGGLRRTSRVDQLSLRSVSGLVRDATDAGLEIEALAGDHQVTPFGPGAERIVLISVSV